MQVISPLETYLSNIPKDKNDLVVFEKLKKKNSKILILGGLGFIGKNFIEYIVEKEIFNEIIVVDKKIPIISHILQEKMNLFENRNGFYFYQKDICKELELKEIFQKHGGIEIVVCLAGETRPNMNISDYKMRNLELQKLAVNISIDNSVKQFIFVSNAKIYKNRGSKETDKNFDPWDLQSEFSLKVEEYLKLKSDKINVIILRTGIIYGLYDYEGEIMLRLTAGIIYKKMDEVMKLIWDGSLLRNTLNVYDLCRAILYCIIFTSKNLEIFNVCDDGNTDGNIITKIIEEIFKVKIEFLGKFRTFLLQWTLDNLINMLNEKHMVTWFELCYKQGIENSPLNILVNRDQLINRNLEINNELIKKELKFEISIKKLDIIYFRALIETMILQGIFPNF